MGDIFVKIGVIGSKASCEIVKKSIKEIDSLVEVVSYEEEQVNRSDRLIEGCELECDAVLFTGRAVESFVGQNYHFTKGFFGTNGISKQSGLTTPDMNEAMVKKTAMGQCREVFVLADHSKFGNISSVTFGSFQNGTILTDTCPEEYKNSGNVVICG